jgi:TIR domain
MDIFLSYNSADHNVVENIARKLRDESLEPFLDRWHLAPGMRWRPKLEETLSSCKAVAIFVGPGEMGSWQQREVDVALDLQSRNANLPVIPVLLPGCEPPLGFLRQLTWVDLRTQTLDRGIVILAKAARGEPPGPEIQKDSDSVRASICPYRGLLHFREEDAPFFFGREAAIEGLVEGGKHHPFLALVGASGSGKSSVVRAGLVPRLRGDRSTAWEIVLLVPTDQPLKALAAALVPFLEPTKSEVDRLEEAGKLAGLFAGGTVSLHHVVQRILDEQRGTDRVLIFVDQFEELYTLAQDDAVRRKFVDELITASTLSGSKLTVAITLRGDFVGKAFAYRALSDRLQGAQINLGPMTRQELTVVIRKPAEKLQLNFEEGLVERILDAVGDEPGNLPLLEFVLTELWEKRRGGLLLNESYDTMGELKGALAKKANDFFARLSPREQSILQRVFLRLVSLADSGEDTRRRAAFTELPLEAIDLVDKLAKERLLVTNISPTGAAQTVEVAHEALISNWVTLRAWVNEDREFFLWRKRLDGLLREWEGVEKDEGALLRGPLLIEAQNWFEKRSHDLSEEERSFINASRARRERLDGEQKKQQEKELAQARALVEEQKPLAVAEVTPLLDENVQFTVYRPREIIPVRWYKMLIFTHLDERPEWLDASEPSPLEEVQDEAQRILGPRLETYRKTTEESRLAVPREGEITLVPEMRGIGFNPPTRSFSWKDGLYLHLETFELRAGPDFNAPTVVRGRVTIFLGHLILAEVALSIRVSQGQGTGTLTRTPSESSSTRRFRRIFASYSHEDLEIVTEMELYPRLLGDRYLRDLVDLRTGERWNERLLGMITEADIFQLFWSWNSSRSPYVEREWLHALSLRRETFIRPTYWEVPWPDPPELLRPIHFQRFVRRSERHSPERKFDELPNPRLESKEVRESVQPKAHPPSPVAPSTRSRKRKLQTVAGMMTWLALFIIIAIYFNFRPSSKPTSPEVAVQPSAPVAVAIPSPSNHELGHFYFDYQGEPQPGRRIWKEVQPGLWVESYKSGLQSSYKVVQNATIDDAPGVIATKISGDEKLTMVPNQTMQVFIPLKNSPSKWMRFRHLLNGSWGPWQDLAQITYY